MAIAHRASAVANSTNNTTSLTVTIPASVQADDLLFLVTANRGATTDPTVTDNDTGGNAWARIGGQDNTGSGDVYWKRATSGSASKTVTVSGCTDSCSAGLSAFSGGSTAVTPYENVTAEANASGDETNAGFTPSQNGSMVCLAVCNVDTDIAVSTQSSTSPGSLTELFEHLNTGGGDCATCLAAAVQATAGATGNLTWAQGNQPTVSIGWNILPLSAATQNITGALYTDTDTFEAATLSTSYTITGALFANANTFYAADIVSANGPQFITAAIFANANTYYPSVITSDQTITGALFANTSVFYAATIAHVFDIAQAQGSMAPGISQGGRLSRGVSRAGSMISTQSKAGRIASGTVH